MCSSDLGTETELWFRLVLKPISTSMGNTIFRSDALDSRMVIYANSNFSLTSSFGSSAAVATGASTPFDLSSTNLIILHQLIDRATGQPEKTYGWINPASMANMLADAGYNVYLESNIIEGSESYNKLFLYAFRGRDALALEWAPDGSSLSDQAAVLCIAEFRVP